LSTLSRCGAAPQRPPQCLPLPRRDL
jgi:hypothetical protein